MYINIYIATTNTRIEKYHSTVKGARPQAMLKRLSEATVIVEALSWLRFKFELSISLK